MGGRGQSQQQHVHLDGGAADAAANIEYKDAQRSFETVVAYATSGRGNQADLPKHVKRAAGLDDLKARIPDIAKHARGEIVLECAALLGMSLAEQVQHALLAKKKVSAEALRRHLRAFDYDSVAKLADTPGLVGDVRRVLKGPIWKELPELSSVNNSVYLRPELLRWWLETTNSTVAALQLCGWSDPQLVEHLDALAPTTPEAWGWIEHLHVVPHQNVGLNLRFFASATKNEAAKTKLQALSSSFKETEAERLADVPQAQVDLKTELSAKNDQALLDAAARTQGQRNTDSADVRRRLAGESADVVGQYIQTMSSATTLSQKVELLGKATGPRAEHLRGVLRSAGNNDVVALLADDRARKLVRGMLGRDTGIRDVLTLSQLDELHTTIVKDEALRHWCYEDKDPRTLLWLAAGSGAGAKDGCRIVLGDKGKDWVAKLPRSADEVQLRRFVLNTTDAKLAAWVKTNLIADGRHAVREDDAVVVPTSRIVYGAGAERRLDIATAPRHDDADIDKRPDPDRILARLADLSESERAALLASKSETKSLFEDLVGNEQRAVHLLQPTLPQLLAMPIRNAPELASYASGRRMSEQVKAGEQASDARRVFGELSPFVALPLLRAPTNLAQALEDNEALLDWILETTEPNQAIEILAREPVRKVASELLDGHSTVYAGLPAFDNLRKRGRDGFKALAKGMKDEESKEAATDYVDGVVSTDKDADSSAARFSQASKKKLWHGIDALYEAGGTRSEMISLVQASESSDQIELLGGEHAGAVRRMQQRTRLGPQHVFIDLDVTQLLKLPSAAEWLLTGQDSYQVLAMIGDADRAKALGLALSYNATRAESFIQALPRGQALTVDELHVLDMVARHVYEPGVLHRLFGARFDTGIEASYDLGETKRLWGVLERLPPAQVNQKVIRGFLEESLGGPVGLWNPARQTVELEENPAKLQGNDTHFARGMLLTADEVKHYYGLDDKSLAKAADKKAGWLIEENGKYRVKPTEPTQFQATVLHEVGHSIDELLGEHTELVYGLAGWKRYGYDQFETWAAEMGALDHINAKDKPRVVDAWQSSLRSKTAVSKLVSADHPAMQDSTSPLSKWVDEDRPFTHSDTSLKPVNDRVFMQTPTSLASVKKQTWDNAPTDYSMTAPEEFFAECYTEYYCGYDGTKATENRKGGRLANWIKKWFDENVDTIRLSPQRVQGEKADNTEA